MDSSASDGVKHNLATYAPMLIAVVLTWGGAYVVNQEDIATLRSRMDSLERNAERHTDMVVRNGENIAILTERTLCNKED